ncbi:MAG: formylglycine-generating enzyme family protein [Proteobacteria bacterium]|nr:formylglycine-generating enzyme family protein [Pseudomonadota bacterium]
MIRNKRNFHKQSVKLRTGAALCENCEMRIHNKLGVAIGLTLLLSCSRDIPAPAASEKPSSTVDEKVIREPTPQPHKSEIPTDMLGVPGGTFSMGQNGRGIKDEQPAHSVWVTPFLLDKTEVTNTAYTKCVEAKICRPAAHLDTEKSGFEPLDIFRSEDRPVSGVSHKDAETYCKWAKKRLPRETEWERAARGSDGRLFPWGDAFPTTETAVFRGKVTQPVGSRKEGAGPYGHLDLAGNVWEWVADHYDPYAYRRDTASRGIPGTCKQIIATQNELRRKGKQGFTGTNPIPTDCEYVLRGGAFNYFPWGLRSTNRVHHPGRFRMVMAGFRCARDWPDGPSEEDAIFSPFDEGGRGDFVLIEKHEREMKSP